jgi:hypothetical protein
VTRARANARWWAAHTKAPTSVWQRRLLRLNGLKSLLDIRKEADMKVCGVLLAGCKLHYVALQQLCLAQPARALPNWINAKAVGEMHYFSGRIDSLYGHVIDVATIFFWLKYSCS